MKKLLPLFLLLITALACGSVNTLTPDPAATTNSNQPASTELVFTAIPTFTSPAPVIPSPTPPLSQSLTVIDMVFPDSNAEPPYTSTVRLPALQGPNDPRVQAFNELLYRTAQDEAAQFKNDTIAFAPNPPLTGGSSFDLQYSLIGQRAEIWSFKYDISFYSDGAAHPGHYSITINYDLENGRKISLSELFLPGSNYLQIISDVCKSELSTRDIAFDGFSAGADPLPENYTRWNLSTAGLMITFDEYQVAPYAAGPQVVTIPFVALQSVIDPNGALASFMP